MDGTLINSSLCNSKHSKLRRENLGLETLERNFILENINDVNVNSAEFFIMNKYLHHKLKELFEDYYSKTV